jgi:hypothetical protein
MPTSPERRPRRRTLRARAVGVARSAVRRARDRIRGRMSVPTRWSRTLEYATRTGARWHAVEPETPIVRRPPVRYGPLEGDFSAMLAERLPPLGVVELPEACVLGPRGWVVTRDGYLLPEQSLFGTSVGQMKGRGRSWSVVRQPGVVASLASDNAWRNYGHFLYDTLGRVALLRRAGIPFDSIDWFYCPFPGSKARRLLERVGVPLDRVIKPERGIALRCERLLSPSFPGSRRDHPRWLIEWLRAAALPPATPVEPRRRLYVRRLGSRRVSNEAEILPVLEAYGFESYVPEEAADPTVDFAAAEAIVGGHGANLADIVFCPEGAAVIELMSTDHINPYWYAQAETAGLRHAYIVCRATGERAPAAKRPDDSDVHVDVAALREALAALLGAERPAPSR